MTDYEIAILRFIPFPIHRALDFFVGVGLLFAPIHFAVTGYPSALFIVLGLLLVVLALRTRGNFSPTGLDKPLFPGV
jgi:hypothetical protein